MTAETLDYIRITVDVFAIIIFTIGIALPLKNTIIPYWKKFGRPSNALMSRLFIRILLLILVIHNIYFPLLRVMGNPEYPATALWTRASAVPVYLLLTLAFLYSWRHHPDGPNGL